MDINVSQVLAFQRCELDWYYQYVHKRIRRGFAPALEIGTWWHSLMESYFVALRDDPDQDAARDLAIAHALALIGETSRGAIEQGFEEQAVEFTKETRKLLGLFESSWFLKYPPSKIISIEQPLRRRLPSATDALKDSDHYLVGIPDTIVICNNYRWHLQHKTASDRTPMDIFIQTAQRSLHELSYAWLQEGGGEWDTHDFHENYGGTYMNIARKLSQKAINERPESAFVQELIPLAPRQIYSAIRDISCIADRMHRIKTGEMVAIDNREADTNRFGNVLSPYFEVKLGIKNMMRDPEFIDFVSRYEEEGKDAVQ